MLLKPFYETINDELNVVILANMRGDSGKIYNLEVEIDPLNDGLILKKECNCNGMHYKTTKSCKHMNALLESLKAWNIDFREENNELQTEKSD